MSNKINKKIIIPDRESRKMIFSSLPESGEKIDTADLEAAIMVFETSEKIQNALHLHFSRYGFTQARFIVLLTMLAGKNGQYSPLELAERIGVRPPTMTGILDGLVKEGFIERIADASDRRRVNLSLTPKGKKKITAAMPDHFKKISSAFGNLQKRKNLEMLKEITAEINSSLLLLTESLP